MSFRSQRVQSKEKISITKLLGILGVCAASVFAIAVPSIYYISITGRQHTLATLEAAFLAKSVEKIIHERPILWEYESIRLKELISQPSLRGEEHEREIRTAAGRLVAKTDFTETHPIISVSAPFFDSGRLAGSIIVMHSIRTQIITTALSGILSSLISCLIYFMFRSYPLRKLENTLTDLQREREKSDKTLYAIGDGVITADHKGKILFINRVAASLVGRDASESVGQPLDQVYVLHHGQENQLILTSKGRAEYAIEEVRTPLTEAESDTRGVIIVFRDITERERMERAQLFLLQCGYLYPGEDFFASLARYLAENMTADYVCIDRLKGDGLTAKTVAIYSDGKFEDNVEYTLKDTPCGDVVGKTICSFPKDVRHLFPQDIVLQEMLAESYFGTTLWSFDGKPIGLIALIGRKPSENPHLVESILKLVSVRAAGELERRMAQEALSAMEKSRRSMEERLHRAEKMEAVGQLAGGVAHDLNNILGVLSGYSELLVERLPEGGPLKEYATNILKSSEKGAAIIQDLLTLARRGVVVSKVVDLNSILDNLLVTPEFDRLKNYHPRVNFKTALARDLLHIKGSPVHLEKTALNLMSNAAEAISGGGEVIIRTENRYLDQAVPGYDTVEEGDYVVLMVSDTGTGIASEDMKKMFEPFYTKKKMGRSGTGLGLAIVWGTVKDHKGYIDVQSIEGQGAALTLYFPVTREKMGEDAQKMPIEQYIGHGESILVVDDVQEQRQVATTILTELGYQVLALSSGEEAVEYLKEHKADILVLDMIMDPGLDGLQTYKLVIEVNPHQKVIIVSGFSETERVKDAQKLGAGAYVKKPYLKETIGVAIRDELLKVASNNALS